MRPAIEVVSDIDSEFPCVMKDCAVCSKAAAVIEADREALVREIVAWLQDDVAWALIANGDQYGVTDAIERKFIGKDA